ncbi:MAG: recombination protein RecR [Firmicutes bacterium]|nr:recombination protein RecR [Bacillota bacterium]
MIYPKSLSDSINYLKKLPGIGEKSAERMALSIIDMDEDTVKELANALNNCKLNLKKCSICGSLTENEVCEICQLSEDNYRNKNLICVLEDYKSVFAFEKSGKFDGVYHVLGGLISPMNGIGPDDINLSSLIKRVNDLDNPEIIVALKSTIEGEATTLYIKKIFEGKSVKISRLSYGIPMGMDIDYLDELTLLNALSDRKEIS